MREWAERVGQSDAKVGPALWRLKRLGRVRSAPGRGRDVLYEFVPGEAQALNHAVIRAPKHTILDKMLTLLGQFEQQSKAEALELGKLREENARLRRAMKEMAGRL